MDNTERRLYTGEQTRISPPQQEKGMRDDKRVWTPRKRTSAEDLLSTITTSDTTTLEEKYNKIIREFAMNDSLMTWNFPSSLSKEERTVIHSVAEEFELYHYSQGKGNSRYITVQKINTFPLEIGKYESTSWVVAEPNSPVVNISATKLTFVSFNVLFDGKTIGMNEYDLSEKIYTQERRTYQFDMLKAKKADFIALQEVTFDYFHELLQQDWVRRDYYISDLSGRSISPYGNILLSRYRFHAMNMYTYKHGQKSMLLADFQINGRKLRIGVVHLKAGNYKQFGMFRKKQVIETVSLMKMGGVDDMIVLGDFNFKDEDNETHKELEDEYTDVWQKLHGRSTDEMQRNGFTYNLETNSLAKIISDTVESIRKTPGHSSRFDRVYIKCKDQYWKGEDIEIWGNQPIFTSAKGEKIFVSDHFGLEATIQVAVCPTQS